MEGQVPENVKTERSAQLIALSHEMSAAYRRASEGKLEEVPTEEPVTVEGTPYMAGYTRTYIRALVPAGIPENTIVTGTLAGTAENDTMYLKMLHQVPGTFTV